jgi:hypothetical protein
MPLERLLRKVGGNLSAALERLRSLDQLSLPDLAQCCREGKEALMKKYFLPTGSAERITQAGPALFMRIEELDLPAGDDKDRIEHSTGRRAVLVADVGNAIDRPEGNGCVAPSAVGV